MRVNQETYRILVNAFLKNSRDYRNHFRMRDLKEPSGRSFSCRPDGTRIFANEYHELTTMHTVLSQIRRQDGHVLNREQRLEVMGLLTGRQIESTDDLVWAEVKAFNRLAFTGSRRTMSTINQDWLALLFYLFDSNVKEVSL